MTKQNEITAADFGLPELDGDNRVFGERVALPEFEMVSCPTIRLSDIRRNRRTYNIVDLAQTYAREIQNGVDRLAESFNLASASCGSALQSLGQAMANPIHRNLDYQGIGRRIFQVEPMPEGALPTYIRNEEEDR